MIEPIRRVILMGGLACAASAPFYLPEALAAMASPSWPLACAVLAVTAVVYATLPWQPLDRHTVCFDRVPAVVCLDLVGAVCSLGIAGGLMAMAERPDAASAALASAWGVAVGLPWFLWAAYHATYVIRIEDDGRLRLSTWRGAEEWVLADIRAVTPLVVRGIRSGVVLVDVSGECLRLDWTGLLRFELVLGALKAARIIVKQQEV